MELWDIYDIDRRKIGKLHQRGEILPAGAYHLVVGIVVYNTADMILITKRAPEKSTDPGRWESTVGSVLAGEDSLSGACRELYEETGITAAPQEMRLIYQTHSIGYSGGALLDIYTVKKDVPLEQIRFQPEETCDAKWIDVHTWHRGIVSGEILFMGRHEKKQIANSVMDMMNNKENE